ncbi:hypothetical protein ACM66B_004479 [Microbotryomycetes sp. NB124-2]
MPFIDTTSNDKSPYNHGGAPKRQRNKWLWIGIPVALLVVLGAVLGGVFGYRSAHNLNLATGEPLNDSQQSGQASSSASSASSRARSSATGAGTGAGTGGGSGPTSASQTSSRASSTVSSSSVAPSPTAGLYAVENRPAWVWGQDKAIGMCLGNWLILERWMHEDWFTEVGGADSYDEWSFSQHIGDQGALQDVLEQHWLTWITEDDIQTMYEQGINHLRIPTGFWAWIPTVEGEPYLNNQTAYQEQINRILGYAYARGMYAVIDLHGLPGSQNGEQTSGHNTTTPSWFNNDVNQGRSDDTVKAVLDFIGTTPFRSIISGLEVINEPRPYTPAQVQEIEDYYARSYDAIQSSPNPVTMFIADAYEGLEHWRSFVTARATNPPSLVLEDHPYPGNFPPQTDTASILDQVCEAAQRYLNFPVPIVITEWGVYTGVKTTAFEHELYESQLATWAWSGGGMYWSYRLIPSQLQLQAGLDYSQYSFITLVTNSSDVVPAPSSFGVGNTTVRSNAEQYLSSLSTHCGNPPNNVSPNPAPSDVWSAEVAARSSYADEVLTATSWTIEPTATAIQKRSNRKKRSFNA